MNNTTCDVSNSSAVRSNGGGNGEAVALAVTLLVKLHVELNDTVTVVDGLREEELPDDGDGATAYNTISRSVNQLSPFNASGM